MNKAIRELWYRWKFNGDLMTCQECGHSIIATRMHETPFHAAGCKNAGDRNPWLQLSEMLHELNRNGKETVVFACSHIGVSGSTPVHVMRLADGSFAARCGIAVLGDTNMGEAEFDACGHNPFHPAFHDNYAEGCGASEEEALAALAADMRKTADSIWAI